MLIIKYRGRISRNRFRYNFLKYYFDIYLMRIEHQTLTDRIHLLTFDTQQEITSTLLRFQEYYESPEFRGKVFSLEEYKQWYTQNSVKGRKTGEFTYYTDWNGFNIPSFILKPFQEGEFNPLSEKEKRILKLFNGKPEPFYVIGVHRASKNLGLSLKHELAHGLFYTDGDYQNEALAVLSQFDTEQIKSEIKSKGYHEHVLDDECHAYGIACGSKLKTPIPKELSRSLREIYNKYLKIKGVQISQGIVINNF